MPPLPALEDYLQLLAAVEATAAELKLRIDPDGTTEDALFAFENQSLSIVDAGSMFRIAGWLTPETAVVMCTRARRLVWVTFGSNTIVGVRAR